MASNSDKDLSQKPVAKPRSTSPSTSSPTSTQKRNAFCVLMSHATSSTPRLSAKTTSTPTETFYGRDALGAYLSSPSTFPSSIVLSHSEHFVTLHDRFPKSSIHLLLLPRDPVKSHLHPFAAFAATDLEFLESMRREISALKRLVAAELKRKFGTFSALERRREEVLGRNEDRRLAGDLQEEAEKAEEEDVPEGRDWSQDVMAGVHAGPSMNHLHVHVVSRDFVSDRMRHRKHYNSFHTPFFIDLDDFPLAKNDPRRHPGREGYLAQELKCWRCGKDFGNRFRQLKAHLEEEFEEWKKV